MDDRAPATFCIVFFLIALTAGSPGRPGAGTAHRVELPRLANTDIQAVTGAYEAPNTTTLYSQSFDVGPSCNAAGWTTVDLTLPSAAYFHIDDYGGLAPDFLPIQGDKSLWCGARVTTIPCGYGALPGYGNHWDQSWCTKSCIPVSADEVLDVSFIARIDTDWSDVVMVEYTNDCTGATGWSNLSPTFEAWSGPNHVVRVTESNWVGSSPVKVRLRFLSDSGYSDEDGLFPSSGAAHIDSLKAEGLALEDFEGEAVGAPASNDWEACTTPGYGNYFALFKGNTMVQGGCETNLSCVWAAISGSTESFACGGFPLQLAVPKGNGRGQYLSNEIWSPIIPLVGTGSELRLSFSVYRENSVENLVFYTWRVRTITAGCPGPWRDDGFVYYGGPDWIKDGGRPGDWFAHEESIGPLLNLSGAVGVQVALGVVDQCGQWCGFNGSNGACHSHAPLFDKVRLMRVDACGPQWSVRDIDQFQDAFPTDGTITGLVRADIAAELVPQSTSVVRGDSAVITVSDPVSGLDVDPTLGGAAVYLFVKVSPGQPAKSGAALSGDLARWPHAVALDHAGWTALRMDAIGGAPGKYCVDLNDNLFTPGDEVSFYYGARSTGGCWSYASGTGLQLQTADHDAAMASCSEFTCLPASGFLNGGDILYVDGVDGRGGQQYFDTALQQVGMHHLTDRYDIRGSSSTQSNTLSNAIYSIDQLTSCYRKILWDGGDLSVSPNCLTKVSDYYVQGALFQFLQNLEVSGGVYICGDDVSDILHRCSDPGVVFLYLWIPHDLVGGDHRPSFGVSPTVKHVANGAFTDDFVAFGGCPLFNDFDVMKPTGWSLTQMTYGPTGPNNSAVISARKSNGTANVGVVLSGFSFSYIRDDEIDGISDRAKHLHDILVWLSNFPDDPVAVESSARDGLSQNFPNPFNPRTSIAYSIKQRGHVTLRIYDVTGALVRTLLDGMVDAGPHLVDWDGRDGVGQPVASGVYFYRMATPSFSETKRMVVLK